MYALDLFEIRHLKFSPFYLVLAGAQLTRFFEKKIGGNQVSFRVASEDNPKAFTNDDNRFPRRP
jgi:hypothetical protein